MGLETLTEWLKTHQRDPQKHKAAYNRWRQKHLDTERARCRENTRQWLALPHNRIRQAITKRRYHTRLMNEFFARFGEECLCCGEIEPVFLSLDHVQNDGAKKKRELSGNPSSRYAHRSVSTYQIVLDLKRRGWPQEEVQVLCMNCNFAKRRLGFCPHGLAA